MRAKLSRLMLGCAFLAGAGSAANAGGDWNYGGGIKDYSAGVPVPAPIPVPEYDAEYYVRIDTGASWITDVDIIEFGSALIPRDSDDVRPTVFGSLGFGKYITPYLRAEISFDLQTDTDVTYPGVSTFTDTRNAQGIDYTDPGTGITTPTFDTKHYDVTRVDKVKLAQDNGLVSFYYDFVNSSRFTPYVGAGVGFSYRKLKRRAVERAECYDTVNSNPNVDVNYPVGYCASSDDLPNTYSVSAEKEVQRWDFAAAAMAGLSYAVTDNILWDTGYRYLWQGGSMSIDSPTVAGTSVIEVKDVTSHQFRTGLRFNIN